MTLNKFFYRLPILAMVFWLKVDAEVSWKLANESIAIGKSFILTCTIDNIETIDYNVTRQWSVGKDGILVSFNGRRNNPAKYEEVLVTGNQFSLKVNNATEEDILSIYECRYAFDIHKMQLRIDKNKIIYPSPNEPKDLWNDVRQSTVTINTVNCSKEYLNELLNREVMAYHENGSLIKDSFTAKILCTKQNNSYPEKHRFLCMDLSHNSLKNPKCILIDDGHFIAIISVTSVVCLLVLCLIMINLFYLKKIRKIQSQLKGKHVFSDDLERLELDHLLEARQTSRTTETKSTLERAMSLEDNSIKLIRTNIFS